MIFSYYQVILLHHNMLSHAFLLHCKPLYSPAIPLYPLPSSWFQLQLLSADSEYFAFSVQLLFLHSNPTNILCGHLQSLQYPKYDIIHDYIILYGMQKQQINANMSIHSTLCAIFLILVRAYCTFSVYFNRSNY